MSDLSFIVPNRLIQITCNRSETNITALQSLTKNNYYQDSGSATSIQFDYDFFEPVLVDALYLGKISIPVRRAEPSGSNNISFTVLADDNSGFSSAESQSFSIGEDDLLGIGLDDYVRSLTFTTAYRYYRITIARITGSAITWEFSKMILNESFDPQVSPDFPITYESINIKGARHKTRLYEIKYTSIANDLRVEFFEKLHQFKLSAPVVIYDKSSGSVLLPNSEKIAFCNLKNIDYEYRSEGYFDLTLTLESSY
jgi:hypothetical protein